jgi:hypothetical protein
MLEYKGTYIHQQLGSVEKDWTVADLLTCYEPLAGEPLAVRNYAMQQVVYMAEEQYSDLSEAARLRYDFWKQLRPNRIPEQQWGYQLTITNSHQWQLHLTPEGLRYTDVSGQCWYPPGKVSEQLLSDFWFYGPLFPIPDLGLRKQLVAHVRNAFIQAGSPASYAHFKLFEYPRLENPMLWEEGDHLAKDYVCLRQFGIETGATNWRDGLVFSSLLSFERFLADPTAFQSDLTPEIREVINQHLAPAFVVKNRDESKYGTWDEHGADPSPDNARSKQLFMDNAGQTHYIYRDGFGDEYRASPAEENAWRQELLEKYARRIKEEDDGVVLTQIARNMQLNHAKNVEELLLEAANNATSLTAKQGLAQALHEIFNHEKAAELLVSLLQYEEESEYWRNYVFNRFAKMRENRGAQRFIVQCLKGDNEIHFKKAVDVVGFWGLHLGEQPLADRNLLLSLNWEDATAQSIHFTKALEKVVKIVEA